MTPSTISGVGMGVVDATVDNTFSAIVKGSSPVVAYRVGIFKNNATSDLVYNSGVVTLATPFYGTSPTGKTIPFEYVVPSTSGVVNGYLYGYKYILTLWWDVDTQDYTYGCVQSFETVFYAKATPTLSLAPISNVKNSDGLSVIASRNHTFVGNYFQQNNVSIAWFTWTLATADDSDNPITTLGPIYSCPTIEFEYDGFMSGTVYSIKVDAQTQDGVPVSSGWTDFAVSYETADISSAVDVYATKDDGIYVDFGDLKYIEGQPNNDNWRFVSPCPDLGHTCVELDSGTNITFTESEHFQVAIPIEGEYVVSFYIPHDSAEILYASGTDDAGNPYYIRLSFVGHTDGLMPTETLVPSGTLVPNDGTRGNFILDVNGTEILRAQERPIPNTWFVACITDFGVNIYESDFYYNKTNMMIVEDSTYGN